MKTIATMTGSIADRFGQRTFRQGRCKRNVLPLRHPHHQTARDILGWRGI